MNVIEMYTSSTHLKLGLQRALAVAHSLASPVNDAEMINWWVALRLPDQEAARTQRLSLNQLAEVFALPQVRQTIDAGRAAVGLPPADHDAVHAAFRAAIISGRAHRAHGGRDVYGASNKHLWDLTCNDFGRAVAGRFGSTLGDPPVDRTQGTPSTGALGVLHALTEFDTSPKGTDHDVCVQWLSEHLSALDFEIEVTGRELGRSLIIARRAARGLAGHVALYGHYDVTPFGRDHKWVHPPRVLTEADGRLFARGVADNKGALACRLDALSHQPETPALTWLIQGEEETGSRVARQLLPAVMAPMRPTVWLDETGYHDHADGTLRMLARTIGDGDASLPPDAALDELMRGLRGLASRWGIGARHERRSLNKNEVAGGCPFNHNLPTGARYLAIGVNDSLARIHALNESVPAWTFPLHTAQLDVVFRWVNHLAQSAS